MSFVFGQTHLLSMQMMLITGASHHLTITINGKLVVQLFVLTIIDQIYDHIMEKYVIIGYISSYRVLKLCRRCWQINSGISGCK